MCVTLDSARETAVIELLFHRIYFMNVGIIPSLEGAGFYVPKGVYQHL